MKTTEAARYILSRRGIRVQLENQHTASALHKLVEQGFCELDGEFFRATVATPLAMLTPTQLICAQQLAKSGEIGFDSVPNAQKAHMDKLVENGLAIKYGNAWKPTQKLIEAIEYWRKAKDGK